MSKGIIGFIIGLVAVLGGAFVATMLLKNKLAQKDDDLSDFDPLDEPIDDEEFESFFGEDDLPEEEAVAPEAAEEDSEDGQQEEVL